MEERHRARYGERAGANMLSERANLPESPPVHNLGALLTPSFWVLMKVSSHRHSY